MKTKNLFAFALAAVAFTACSNEDSPANDGENRGEIVEAISVKFANGGVQTRGVDGVEDGLAQENKVYHAFVFAKEAAPKHAGARAGDWTVKEVGSATGSEITGGTNVGELGNIATFLGVRQGDNVYVLANYPELDKAGAEVLAYNGENSEATIKAFIANVQKDYLNKLAFSSKSGDNGAPASDSKYIMAGMGTIPVSPTIPNGTTVVVPVKLDREMAKVVFYASVSQNADHAAAGKIDFKNDDGFVVARVAKKASPYTKQNSEWYFPSTGAVKGDKDWDVAGWLNVIDGNAVSAVDGSGSSAPLFNNAPFNADAKEYRFSWKLNASTGAHAYLNNGWMYSPYFYVTPNYSDNAASATVIATQATYVGAPEFKNADAQTLFVKGFSIYTDGGSVFLDKDNQTAASFNKCVWTDAAIQAMNTKLAGISNDGDKEALAAACGWAAEGGDNGKTKLAAAVAVLAKVTKAKAFDISTDADMIAELSYYDGLKLFYRADIANYSEDNSVSYKNTERNMYYKIRATITSLGAKSIEEAINSDDVTMQVEVTVNKWNVVFNDIQM